MKNLLEKISQKTGLITTEIKTFLFVVIVFISGIFIKYTKISLSDKQKIKYDYSFHDSLFKAINEDYISSKALKKKEKRVDSKVELSDFSKKKFDSKKNIAFQLKERSINLNTATEKQLTQVSGIGSTIAKRIVELRKRKGGYKSLDELIEVKRIGSKKLEVIKKYIYIEK